MKLSYKIINKIIIYFLILIIIITIFYFLNKSINIEYFVEHTKKNNINSNPLNIPLRYQWNTNKGYCGEVCFITAGLMLGQYFSQYDIRQISHCTYNNVCGCDGDKGQLLLGVNDDKIAEKLHFKYETYYSKKGKQEKYYSWIKKKLSARNIIVSAFYENFGNNFFKEWNNNIPPNKNKFGDEEYDHIVIITNITKDNLYINDLGNYQNYLIDATDNDRYNQQTFFDSIDYKNLEYIFKIPLKEGIKDRINANKDTKYHYLIPYISNYGISISGLSDKYNNQDLIPLSIEVDKNYELPRVPENSESRPIAMKLQLKVTASNLSIGKKYCILKFNDITKVTDKNFNIIEENASNNFKLLKTRKITNLPIKFTANSNKYIFSDNILSSDQAIYRCFKIKK